MTPRQVHSWEDTIEEPQQTLPGSVRVVMETPSLDIDRHLVDQSPEPHPGKCQRDTGNSGLSSLHAKHAFALQNLSLLSLQLRVS